jgi:ribonuclease VapC
MIVDTSAALAVVLGEPGFEVFAQAISACGTARISAASFLEASIVVETRAGDRGLRQFDSFIRESELAVEPVTHEQALLAREGFSNYGKGRHPAGLNFGDCFAYALAKSTGEPLLFKGEDFRQTDVVAAL